MDRQASSHNAVVSETAVSSISDHIDDVYPQAYTLQ